MQAVIQLEMGDNLQALIVGNEGLVRLSHLAIGVSDLSVYDGRLERLGACFIETQFMVL